MRAVAWKSDRAPHDRMRFEPDRESLLRQARRRRRLPLAMTLILGMLVFASPFVAHANDASDGVEQTRVDLNTADVDALCTLPGIGKKRAESIIRYREKKPFTRVTQLLNIRGIGRKTLRRLRPMLSVSKAKPAAKREEASAKPRTKPLPTKVAATPGCPKGQGAVTSR
jgi:competence ComEA-like helix-hairpin-helix protein